MYRSRVPLKERYGKGWSGLISVYGSVVTNDGISTDLFSPVDYSYFECYNMSIMYCLGPQFGSRQI